MTAYSDFLAGKARRFDGCGFDVDPADLHPSLFGFQRDVTAWAIRKGRAALFLDTGLGKTRCQVEWARAIVEHEAPGRALILAPLAVAQQTIREAAAIGVEIAYVRDDADVRGLLHPAGPRIAITNYERMHKIDPHRFGAVVLDESSILKAFSGKVKRQLVAAFDDTPYRLCCTATPAPNDVEELCNHADFLGVMSPAEMRSTFFIAATRAQFMKYRLKGHAEEPFYRWLASWAMAVRKPSDLGHADEAFALPPLHTHEHVVTADWQPDDRLFADRLNGVTERSQVRAATIEDRVARAAELIEAEPDESWLCWVGRNDEGRLLARAAGEYADVALVEGSDDPDDKARALLAFQRGDVQVLVTKAKIAGYGMNFQRCARTMFVGLDDSFEAYYQAIRRVWRYGQAREVHAHVVISDVERQVYANVLDKQRRHDELAAGLLRGLVEHERAELYAGTSKGDSYEPAHPLTVPDWIGASA